ncbi:MAG: hypothetical protein JO298_10090 [Verrucomicrobia bacterium]|nr:hypothetical protein [Verrucomicrobiota bacterium]
MSNNFIGRVQSHLNRERRVSRDSLNGTLKRIGGTCNRWSALPLEAQHLLIHLMTLIPASTEIKPGEKYINNDLQNLCPL